MSDQTAFAEVYEATIPAVWRFVHARVGNREEAEDLTSEVYVRALVAWNRFDARRGGPTAWLCGIATHVVQEWRRGQRSVSRGALPERSVANIAGEGLQPEAVLLQAEEIARVRAALTLLNERERDALALRFAAGLRASEVAPILGLSIGATKMLFFRAMERLRGALERGAPSTVEEQVAATALDETVDRVLAGRRTGLPEHLAERLVRQLAMVHSSHVPQELTERIRSIVACPVTRAVTGPSRWFGLAAALVAGVSLAGAAWSWQAAATAMDFVDRTGPLVLLLAGSAMLGGLGLLLRRPSLGAGTVGIGALIFAFCLWWTGIAPLVGIVMAGLAFRESRRLPARAAQ